MQPQVGMVTSGPSASQQLPVLDRIALFGLVASIGHSLGDPMTAIAAGASSLRADRKRPVTIERAVESLISSAQSACHAVRQASKLIRSAIDPSAIDVVEVVRSAVARAEAGLNVRAEWRYDVCPDAMVWGDPETIGRLIDEVIVNALEACVAGNDAACMQIEIVAAIRDEALILEVVDRGIGVEDLGKIFDMFFTTKTDRTGQGLSIARGLAIANGGMLWASANEPQGTRITLSLPVA